MVQLQTINKILQNSDMSIVINNALDSTYFEPYSDEYDFISDHYEKYHKVPDKETFLEKFPDFTFVEVTETDKYLIDALFEDKLYRDTVPVIKQAADLLKVNANDAVQYLMSNAEIMNRHIGISSVDIAKNAEHRYDIWNKKKNGADVDFYIPTGFEELDEILHGWSRGEELVILFARTNQGKSWVLAKMLSHAWRVGYKTGFISPEMSPDKIGYRVDTLVKHFDNTALNFGRELDGYKEYITDLSKSDTPFIVSTPADFDHKITVSKLRAYIEVNKLDILGIDGMSYLSDERCTRYDKREAELTHISEDLFSLSMELKVPIIGVVQANRDGVKINGGDLGLENIRDADGISYNASKVISIRQRVDEETLELNIKKNRDGAVGGKLLYKWTPNLGDLVYLPSNDDCVSDEKRKEKIDDLKAKFEPKKGASVF